MYYISVDISICMKHISGLPISIMKNFDHVCVEISSLSCCDCDHKYAWKIFISFLYLTYMTLIYQPFMNSYYSETKDTYAGNHICQREDDLSIVYRVDHLYYSLL